MFRLAVIGLGAVAQNIQLPAYARLRNSLTVVGGCDLDPRAQDLARRQWKLPYVCADPRELIDKTKPDIVSICTPPSLHCAHSILALEAGAHVFCEKPMAETLEQADEMIAKSAAARRRLVINNQFPCMRIYAAAKLLVGSSEFGRLLYLHAWQSFLRTEITEAGWRGRLKRRTCFEFGIHVFELVRFFFEDEPVRIMAHMPVPDAKANGDVIDLVSLEFADGRAASILLNRLSKGPERYLDMRLDGEFASIHSSIGGRIELKAGLHTRERRPFIDWRFAQGGHAVLQVGNRSRVIATDPLNPFVAATSIHFANFLAALQSGSVPVCSAKDNRNTLALVCAAYDSARLGQTVEMRHYRDDYASANAKTDSHNP
jgi:D-apiose dehydrogenase